MYSWTKVYIQHELTRDTLFSLVKIQRCGDYKGITVVVYCCCCCCYFTGMALWLWCPWL